MIIEKIVRLPSLKLIELLRNVPHTDDIFYLIVESCLDKGHTLSSLQRRIFRLSMSYVFYLDHFVELSTTAHTTFMRLLSLSAYCVSSLDNDAYVNSVLKRSSLVPVAAIYSKDYVCSIWFSRIQEVIDKDRSTT